MRRIGALLLLTLLLKGCIITTHVLVGSNLVSGTDRTEAKLQLNRELDIETAIEADVDNQSKGARHGNAR